MSYIWTDELSQHAPIFKDFFPLYTMVWEFCEVCERKRWFTAKGPCMGCYKHNYQEEYRMRQSVKEKHKLWKRKWRELNPEKQKAQNLAQKKIPEKPCVICGSTKNLCRHHDGKSVSFEVSATKGYHNQIPKCNSLLCIHNH